MSKNIQSIKTKLSAIFARYTRGEASADEQQFVDRLYDQIGTEETVPSDLTTISKDIKSRIDRGIAQKGAVRKISVSTYLKVAATLLITGVVSFVVWYNHQGSDVAESVLDVAAFGKVPVLTIGEDQRYELTDTFAHQLSYITIDDQKVLVLADLEKSLAEDSPRRISNPTKQVFTFLLDDGTQVWLNAHSYVEFASGFGRVARIVSTYGEVSFDVKKQFVDGKALPFVVKTPLQTIEVLGTQFSVNTDDASEESLFLLEGKVKLTHNNYNSSVILAPGQKAHLNSNNAKILVASNKDGYKVKAWRKGLFHFEGERLAQVMDELAQWYEQPVNVAHPLGEIPITGIVSRYEKIEDVLQIVELTANVKFVKKGGMIYVTKDN